jgi:hypothetical protein
MDRLKKAWAGVASSAASLARAPPDVDAAPASAGAPQRSAALGYSNGAPAAG